MSVLEEGLHLKPMVYVLLLEGNRRYVGVSLQVHNRICSHFQGLGSAATKRWKPVAIESVRFGGLDCERETTLDLMVEHGWETVFGSSWCKIYRRYPPKPYLERLRAGKEVLSSSPSSESSIPEIFEIDVPDYTATTGKEWPIRGVADSHVGSWRATSKLVAEQSTIRPSEGEDQSCCPQSSRAARALIPGTPPSV